MQNHSKITADVTDAEAEIPIFWPSDVKSQLIGGDLDAEKN